MSEIIGRATYANGERQIFTDPEEFIKTVQEELPYSAATWVVINADGEIPKAINDIYQEFYSEWLPCSGYKLSGLPIFECYMQENHQEVWIAVEKA